MYRTENIEFSESLRITRWRFKSKRTKHSNLLRSFIYFPTTCFGRSIPSSSGRNHK